MSQTYNTRNSTAVLEQAATLLYSTTSPPTPPPVVTSTTTPASLENVQTTSKNFYTNADTNASTDVVITFTAPETTTSSGPPTIVNGPPTHVTPVTPIAPVFPTDDMNPGYPDQFKNPHVKFQTHEPISSTGGFPHFPAMNYLTCVPPAAPTFDIRNRMDYLPSGNNRTGHHAGYTPFSPPLWKIFSSQAWMDFKNTFQTYHATGGTAMMQQCITHQTAFALQDHIPPDVWHSWYSLSYDQVIKHIGDIFQPKSFSTIIAKLSAIRMDNFCTMTTFSQYTYSFIQMMEQVNATCYAAHTKILQFFL